MSVSHANATTARRGGRWRWFVALIATVAMAVAGSGLVAFAQSGAPASRSAEWAPAGTPILVIGRMDMPGGQAEALAQALTAFPGFADPASFDMKLTEALDGMISEATEGRLTFSGEIQSFFGGEIGLALPNVMEAAMSGSDPDILVGISITDRPAAESFVALLTAGEDELGEEAYDSTTILSDEDVALAVTDGWILLSQTPELVKAGLDTLSGAQPSLAAQEGYAEAIARVPAGHLGAAYFDLTSFADLITLGMAASGGMGPAEDAITAQLLEQLPRDMVAYLAAGPSTITLQAFITPGEGTPAVTVGESDLATGFPAGTQLYVETRELGANIKNTVGQLLELMPEEEAQSMAPFEDMLGTDLASFLDFVGDAAIGAAIDEQGIWLGMIGEVTDEAVAQERVQRILTLVGLFGAGEESGVSVEQVDVGGVDVTVITLPVEEMGGAGLPIALPDRIAIAVTDGRLVLGTGEFVAATLELGEVDSLALDPGYVDAIGADTTNSGVLYANIGGLLTAVDPLMTMMVPEWPEIQPWVAGLDRLVAVGAADEDVISTRMTLHLEAQ